MPRKMSPPSFQQDQHYPHPHLYHRLPHPVKKETPAPAVTTTTNINNHVYGRMTPSSLKVNRDSHMIKKSSFGTQSPIATSPTGSSSTKPNQQQQQQQQRGPVIIYTHSPKVIHTNPRDFMALVQKLTGMPRNKEAGTSSKESESSVANHEPAVPNVDYTPQQYHQDNNMSRVEGARCIGVSNNNNNNNHSSNSTDDNESSSVITDENCSSSGNNTGDVVGQFNPYMTPQLFDLLPAPPNLPLYMPSSSDMLCYGGDPAIYDYDINFPYDQIT